MTTPLQSQAALEQAVVDLMRASLGFSDVFCGRQFDGSPPAAARGKWYAAVWHDGSRKSGPNGAQTTALDAEHGLTVTVTREVVQPADKWHLHRDELEATANQIIAAVHKDVYDNAILNAANDLAGFRNAGDPTASGAVGFYRGLAWLGTDAVVVAGPEWLQADPESRRVAMYQSVRFGGAMRTQNPANVE